MSESIQRMREAAGRLMADGKRRAFWEIERELCPHDPRAVTVDALDLNAAVIAMRLDGELEKDPDGRYRAHVRRRPYECKMALVWLAKDLEAHAMQAECSREAEGYFLARGSVIMAMRTIEAAMESRYEDDCRKAMRREAHDRRRVRPQGPRDRPQDAHLAPGPLRPARQMARRPPEGHLRDPRADGLRGEHRRPGVGAGEGAVRARVQEAAAMKADGHRIEMEALTAFLSVEVDGVRHVVEWHDAREMARCLDGLRMRFSAETLELGWDSLRGTMTVKTILGTSVRLSRDEAHRMAEGARRMADSWDDWRMRQEMDRWRRDA